MKQLRPSETTQNRVIRVVVDRKNVLLADIIDEDSERVVSATNRDAKMIRQAYHRIMKSLQGPITIPASFIGLAERNEWIRNHRLLQSFEATEKGSIATEEIIRILGTDYDSLEGLLSVTIPTADDRLNGTIEKDDVIYRTTAELTLVSRFLAEGQKPYQYGRLLLAALRAEKDRRNQEDVLGRSKGFCCSTMEFKSSSDGRSQACECEKPMPESWEIGRTLVD